MAVLLREAEIGDAASIASQIKTRNTEAEIVDQITAFRASDDRFHLVAVDEGGAVVGNAVLLMPSRYPVASSERSAEIADFVVHASHSGKGLARRLVETLAVEARRRGARRLDIACSADNDRAVIVYTALGFAVRERIQHESDRSNDLVVHSRELPEPDAVS